MIETLLGFCQFRPPFQKKKLILPVDFPSSIPPMSGACLAQALRDGAVRHQGLEGLPAVAVAGADHGGSQCRQGDFLGPKVS